MGSVNSMVSSADGSRVHDFKRETNSRTSKSSRHELTHSHDRPGVLTRTLSFNQSSFGNSYPRICNSSAVLPSELCRLASVPYWYPRPGFPRVFHGTPGLSRPGAQLAKLRLDRRERDLNPRGGCPPSGFRVRRLRPLGHLSAKDFTTFLENPPGPKGESLPNHCQNSVDRPPGFAHWNRPTHTSIAQRYSVPAERARSTLISSGLAIMLLAPRLT